MLPNEALTEVMHTCVQRGVLLARLWIHVPRLDQMLNLNRRSFRLKTLLPAATGPGFLPENHSSGLVSDEQITAQRKMSFCSHSRK